ncbi:MAG TPA: hypothetical protein VFU74_12695 [Actinocrinis sp.]|nr:hypothetical protein [Actinocrinis sp.]
MTSPRRAAGQLRRRGRSQAAELRAARRLAAVLILLAGGVSHGGPAGAALFAGFFIQVSPVETTLGQFTTMDITADGTDLGERLTITLRGQQIASGETGTGDPQNSDALVLNGVAVPAGLATCGANTVNLVWIGQVQASTTVQVYCPTVKVTPDPINSAGGPAQFTVTGTGYPPLRDVALALDGAGSSFTGVVTDRTGAFVKPTSRPQLACGPHTLTGTGASGQPVIESVRPSAVEPFPVLPASTTFSVTGCAGAPGQLKLTANPAVFIEGSYTHVTGTGFVPGQPVTLAWQSPAGATLSACSPTADPAPPPVADAKGDLDTFCFAAPHEILGAAQIAASQTTTQGAVQSTQHAAAPVVIEGGSMQPSSGEQLIFRR